MILQNIKEIESLKLEDLGLEDEYSYSRYEGYEIETDKEKIYLLITDSQSCCEHFGYICNEESDDFDAYYGCKITDIECIEEGSYNPILKLAGIESASMVDCLDCAFINIKFKQSTLQFAVYNHHNGYYGHDIRIVKIPK